MHIGGDTMVALKNIIGIFDIHLKDNTSVGNLLRAAKERNAVEVVEVGDVKSFIVTDDKVYLSPISSVTLKKRAYVLDTAERIEFH
ncbi:extracellular matrix regulator RemB [Alicyclobacillus cycloheptanicus]|jgi:hypothetical protein|nr:extracellular matrix/biofilm biosynthesis regulator RemA family protein [Alicyclobacillus cycloheptanicus]